MGHPQNGIGEVATSTFLRNRKTSDFYAKLIPSEPRAPADLAHQDYFVPAFWPGGWERNYFHWTLDILPSILATIEWAVALERAVYVLKPSSHAKDLPAFVNQWLDLLEHRFSEVAIVDEWSEKDVPSHVFQIVNGRIRRKGGATKGTRTFTTRIDDQLVSLLRRFSPANVEDGELKSRILVSRRNSPTRQRRTDLSLEETVVGYGFQSVLLERLTITDQATLFSNASHVAGLHGAGLANLVWTSNAKVFEFVGIRHVILNRRTEYRQVSRTRGNEHTWLWARDPRTQARLATLME